jgi:hypothetical protein
MGKINHDLAQGRKEQCMTKPMKKSEPANNDSYPEGWDAKLTPAQKAILSPAGLRSILKEFDRHKKSDAWERVELAAVFDGVLEPEPVQEESEQQKLKNMKKSRP